MAASEKEWGSRVLHYNTVVILHFNGTPSSFHFTPLSPQLVILVRSTQAATGYLTTGRLSDTITGQHFLGMSPANSCIWMWQSLRSEGGDQGNSVNVCTLVGSRLSFHQNRQHGVLEDSLCTHMHYMNLDTWRTPPPKHTRTNINTDKKNIIQIKGRSKGEKRVNTAFKIQIQRYTQRRTHTWLSTRHTLRTQHFVLEKVQELIIIFIQSFIHTNGQ